MKLLFVSNLYPPNVVGGYERLCFEMAEALAGRGHDVAVLTSDYGGGVADYPGQRVHRGLKLFADDRNIYQPFDIGPEDRATRSAANVAELRRVLAEERPELIFVWNLFFLDPPFLDALQAAGLPLAYLLTDNWLIAFLNAGFIGEYMRDRVFGAARQRPGLRQRLRQRLARPRFPLRGRAILASHFMDQLYREAGFGFSDRVVLHHGVHLDPAGGHARARQALRVPGELHLLFAGRIVDIKGVHTAVEALPLLRDALPELRVHLSIVGDGQDAAYRQRLEEMADAGGVAGAIHWQEPVPADRLAALFDAHDIYLFPSLYEPFSLTLIHALHAGIPTVASDAGGNGEIVFHRRTGLLFPRGDAPALARQVLALARDSRLRARLAEAGARRAARHDFSGMVAAVARELERCVDGGQG